MFCYHAGQKAEKKNSENFAHLDFCSWTGSVEKMLRTDDSSQEHREFYSQVGDPRFKHVKVWPSGLRARCVHFLFSLWRFWYFTQRVKYHQLNYFYCLCRPWFQQMEMPFKHQQAKIGTWKWFNFNAVRKRRCLPQGSNPQGAGFDTVHSVQAIIDFWTKTSSIRGCCW